MINSWGKGDSASGRVVEKDPQKEGILGEFWKTNDSPVNGQKGNGYPKQRW